MIEHLQDMEALDRTLTQRTPEQLEQLYVRVFNSPDGELVLRDLSNRCYVDKSTSEAGVNVERAEGMRDLYLTIITRMRNTVITKEEDDEES